VGPDPLAEEAPRTFPEHVVLGFENRALHGH
jgi:hypothetical protein